MRSLDTNVLARFFINDLDDTESAAQRPAAISALSEPALVTVTVVLEFEWVLRGFYGLRRSEIVEVLRALAGIAHIELEDRLLVLDAIDATEAGLDFADALHWYRSRRATSFATFDRTFYKRASKLKGEAGPRLELLASTVQ